MGGSFGAGNYALCGKAFDPRFISSPDQRYAVMGAEQASDALAHHSPAQPAGERKHPDTGGVEYEKTGKLPERTPFLVDGRKRNSYATDDFTRPSSRQRHPVRRWPGCWARTSISFMPGTTSPRWHSCLCSPSTKRPFRASGTRCVIGTTATCLGFGRRFLHSTGQDYKGGPNTEVF